MICISAARLRGTGKINRPQRSVAWHIASVSRRISENATPAANGCLIWTRRKNENGYGTMEAFGRLMLSHRAALMAATGDDVPPGMLVCHRCDTPSCVNVEHLYIGTVVDNARDMCARGRTNPTYGSRHKNSKLAEADVIQLKHRARGGEDFASIARSIGVSRNTVSRIVHGNAWHHVPALATATDLPSALVAVARSLRPEVSDV